MVSLVESCVLTNLHHLQAKQSLELPCILLQPSFASWDPFGLLGEEGQAWQRIQGWGLQSTYEPTTRMVFQSCSST